MQQTSRTEGFDSKILKGVHFDKRLLQFIAARQPFDEYCVWQLKRPSALCRNDRPTREQC